MLLLATGYSAFGSAFASAAPSFTKEGAREIVEALSGAIVEKFVDITNTPFETCSYKTQKP